MITDDPGLVRFVREEHPRLVGAIALYTGDLDLAEECAAEALARVARDWRRVGAMASPGAYTHRTAMNLANSWFRRRAAGRRALARHGPMEDVGRDPDAADVLAVREAVAALPERQRATVVLRHFSGLEPSEIAEVLGVRPGTVRSNLHAAQERLRQLLGDDVVTASTITEARDDS